MLEEEQDVEVLAAHMRAYRTDSMRNMRVRDSMEALDMYLMRLRSASRCVVCLLLATILLSTAAWYNSEEPILWVPFFFGAFGTFTMMWFEIIEILHVKRKIKIIQESLKYLGKSADNISE